MKRPVTTIIFLILIQGVHAQEALHQKLQADAVERNYDGAYAFSNRGLAQIMLTGYQKIISPQLNGECLYTTSCSRYSRKAINRYGLIKGVFLTGDRLTRCNRFILPHVHYHEIEDGAIIDEP